MSYGYIGDTSTSIKQQVKNAGVLSMNDVLDLEGKGQLGGSLELIEEQTVSSATQYVDFTNIKENVYDVHLLQYNNFQHDGTNERLTYQFFENDVIENGSVYYNASQVGRTTGTFSEVKTQNVTYGRLGVNVTPSANYKDNGYLYIYNAGNSSKYTFTTVQTIGRYTDGTFSTEFGSGVLPQASLVNGIRLLTFATGVNITSLTAKLYGVKQI